MSWKWKIFLDNFLEFDDKKNSFLRLLKIYWVSDFFSLFSFGFVGGEFYKMIKFNNKKKALKISLFDKLFSFFYYLLFLFMASLFFLNKKIALIALVIFVLLILMLFKRKSFNFLGEIFFFDFIKKHFFVSTLFLIIMILIHYLVIVDSFQQNIPFFIFFLFTPTLIILTTLPISYQGLGVREAAFIFLGNFYGLSPEGMVASSLFIFFGSIFYRLLGFLPFIIEKEKIKFEFK
jgi:hypothetical protein